MTLPDITLYTRLEYFDELTRAINQTRSGDSITLMTMPYDTRVPEIALLAQALKHAAKRGAKVLLTVDALSFTLAKHSMPGPYFYGRKPSAHTSGVYGLLYRELETLRKAGGDYAVINQPGHAFANPYAGRSHIKLGLVNDRIFIPTCNLDNNRNFDVVVSWRDRQTANWLRTMAHDIRQAGNVREAFGRQDRTRIINKHMTLLVDSGVPGVSTIYDQALQLIDSHPEQLFMVCQYFPGDVTGRHLAAALHAGSSLELHFGHPSSHGKQVLLQTAYNAIQRLRLPASMFKGMLPAGTPKLHAKILTSTDISIIGSHNLVAAGVKLGTAELALRVESPAFAKALREKVTGQLPAKV